MGKCPSATIDFTGEVHNYLIIKCLVQKLIFVYPSRKMCFLSLSTKGKCEEAVAKCGALSTSFLRHLFSEGCAGAAMTVGGRVNSTYITFMHIFFLKLILNKIIYYLQISKCYLIVSWPP